MAEQFSKVFNLFDYPAAVLNPWTSGDTAAIRETNPLKLFFIVYVDGRVQIDGQAYLDNSLPDVPIAADQVLFDVSKIPELDRLLPPTSQKGIANSFVNMTAKLSGIPSLEVNYAEYRPSAKHITYQDTAANNVVTENVVWRFTGWLVPRSLTNTSTLLWGK
jgi:hypothetical protein